MDNLVVEQFDRLLTVALSESDWPEVEASGFLDYFADTEAEERIERFATMLHLVWLEAPRLDGAPITHAMLARLQRPDRNATDTEASGKPTLPYFEIAFRTAQLGGWVNEIERLTIDYATHRKQFGKPLAKFQAVQQQLAVLAEECVAVRMACLLLFTGDPANLRSLRVQAAALQVQASARAAARVAHAVHGAIGITTEYRLGALVDAIHRTCWLDGGPQTAAIDLGRRTLSSDQRMLDLMRAI